MKATYKQERQTIVPVAYLLVMCSVNEPQPTEDKIGEVLDYAEVSDT